MSGASQWTEAGNIAALRGMYKNDPTKNKCLDRILSALAQLKLKSDGGGPNPGWATLPRVGPANNSKPMDMAGMYNQVRVLRGFDEVEKHGKWEEVVRNCKVQYTSSFVDSARRHYVSLVLPYERVMEDERRAKFSQEMSKVSKRPAPAEGYGSQSLPAAKRASFGGSDPNDIVGSSNSGVIDNNGGAEFTSGGDGKGSGTGMDSPNGASLDAAAERNGNGLVRGTPGSPSSRDRISYAKSASLDDAIEELTCASPEKLAKAINFLTLATFHQDDPGQLVPVEKHLPLVVNLTKLLDIFNPMDVSKIGHTFEFWDYNLNERVANPAWKLVPPVRFGPADIVLIDSLDSCETLKSIMCLMRNLAFDAASHATLAYYVPALRHTVCLAMCSNMGDPAMPVPFVCRCACDIIVHIARCLDLTGKRRINLDLWNTPYKAYQNNPVLRTLCVEDMSSTTQHEYQNIALCLLHWCWRSVAVSEDREEVIRGLDVLYKLVGLPENVCFFAQAPASFYKLLVSMLAVTSTCVDPITGQTDLVRRDRVRASASFGIVSDLNDTDIRDLAVDLMHGMVTADHQCRMRMAAVPGCIGALVRLVASYSGEQMERGIGRPDHISKSAVMLNLFAQGTKNVDNFYAMKTYFLNGAFSDDGMHELFVNSQVVIDNVIAQAAAAAQLPPPAQEQG